MTSISGWLAKHRDLPRLDCELLLVELLKLSRAQVITRGDEELEPAALKQLNAWVAELRHGTPVAYLLEEKEFWGLSLTVNPAVLIPRPETELLVELTLELAPPQARVLDLGTGSGAIAIAIAHERADLSVCAVDVSSAALAVAIQNAERHGVEIEFEQSDWFSALCRRAPWHIIVSNPPYIDPADPHLRALAAEPTNALVAADAGIADLTHIADRAPDYLLPQGYLILEHGYNQAAQVRKHLTKLGFLHVRSAQDLAHIERATLGCKS